MQVILKTKVSLLFVCLTLISNVLFTLPARADENPGTLVIVDTALNSDQIEYSKNVIYEVCILEWYSCPNGSNFMEGKGSAFLQNSFIQDNGFNHGTQMVSAAVRTNPDLQIIFIRMVANSNSGARLNVSPLTVAKVLKWVSDNKTKFNIQAIAMSQGHHNLSSLTRYCPSDYSTEAMVTQLRKQGVLLFVPAGNGRDYERLDWPACIPDAVSIGALNPNKEIASYSNLDQKLIDYFELGTLTVKDFSGYERVAEGTSVAVQIAAAKWMQFIGYYPNLSTEDRLQEFDRFTRPVTSTKFSNGKAFPDKIENPEVKIYLETEYKSEIESIKSQLAELRDLIELLIAALKIH